jgi:putative glycosyltransferase
MKLSVVTTIYRNAGDIEEFHARAIEAARDIGAELELIFVNDASPDNGLSVAKNLIARDRGVVVVDLSRNFGQHRALWSGLAHATGDLIAIMDGDLEEDPLWLVSFHRRMQESGCDVVYGVQSAPKGGVSYRASRRLFYVLLNTLATTKFPVNVVTARLMTRRYVQALLEFQERELFLTGVLHMAGFEQTGMPVNKPSRSLTTYNLRRLSWTFVNAVTAFSTAPLTAIFLAGVGISACAVLFILYILVRYFAFGIQVEGWTSVMAALFFFSGILLCMNGIMAIYIGTIFLEVKRRPLSIVREIYRAKQE